MCRIYAPDTDTRGTGFLVAPNRVLTAAHVVRSTDASTKPYGRDNLELRFVDPTPGIEVITSNVVKGAFDPDLDWALLEIKTNMPGVEPLPLRPLRADFLPIWYTYGFPGDKPIEGDPYRGDILLPDPRRFRLQIDGEIKDPFGLSGAPCIVGGYVVGMLLDTQSAVATERLYGVSMERVVAACRPEKLNYDEYEVPYTMDVVQTIQSMQPLLGKTARTLGLVSSDADLLVIEPEDLRVKVAQAMMRELPNAVAGVGSLQRGFDGDEQAALEIVDWAGRTWIDHQAIEALWEALDSNHLVVLNTGQSDIASWFVHRAGCLRANAPGIFELNTPLLPATLGKNELKSEFEKQLLALFPREKATTLRARLGRSKPVVVWIPGLPERKHLDEMRQPYPEVRIILLVGPTIPPKVAEDYGDARIITPLLDEPSGEKRRSAHKQAIEDVEDTFLRQARGR